MFPCFELILGKAITEAHYIIFADRLKISFISK